MSNLKYCNYCKKNVSISNFPKHKKTKKHLANIGTIKLNYEKNENEYKCIECDYKTKFKGSLNRHIKTVHNGEKTYHYYCNVCNINILFKNDIKKHTGTDKHSNNIRSIYKDISNKPLTSYELNEQTTNIITELDELKHPRINIYKKQLKDNIKDNYDFRDRLLYALNNFKSIVKEEKTLKIKKNFQNRYFNIQTNENNNEEIKEDNEVVKDDEKEHNEYDDEEEENDEIKYIKASNKKELPIVTEKARSLLKELKEKYKYPKIKNLMNRFINAKEDFDKMDTLYLDMVDLIDNYEIIY